MLFHSIPHASTVGSPQNPALEWLATLRMFRHLGLPPTSSALIVWPPPADARSHQQLNHPGSQRTRPSVTRAAARVRRSAEFPAEHAYSNKRPTYKTSRGPRLLVSHQCDPGSIPGRATPDFRIWELCRTMPLVGGFSQGFPVYTALSFWRCSIFTANHPHRCDPVFLILKAHFGQQICRPYSDRVNLTSLDTEFRTRPQEQLNVDKALLVPENHRSAVISFGATRYLSWRCPRDQYYQMSGNSRIRTAPHESIVKQGRKYSYEIIHYTLRLRENRQESSKHDCSEHVVFQSEKAAVEATRRSSPCDVSIAFEWDWTKTCFRFEDVLHGSWGGRRWPKLRYKYPDKLSDGKDSGGGSKTEEHTRWIQVDPKQGFQKCSFYREPPIRQLTLQLNDESSRGCKKTMGPGRHKLTITIFQQELSTSRFQAVTPIRASETLEVTVKPGSHSPDKHSTTRQKPRPRPLSTRVLSNVRSCVGSKSTRSRSCNSVTTGGRGAPPYQRARRTQPLPAAPPPSHSGPGTTPRCLPDPRRSPPTAASVADITEPSSRTPTVLQGRAHLAREGMRRDDNPASSPTSRPARSEPASVCQTPGVYPQAAVMLPTDAEHAFSSPGPAQKGTWTNILLEYARRGWRPAHHSLTISRAPVPEIPIEVPFGKQAGLHSHLSTRGSARSTTHARADTDDASGRVTHSVSIYNGTHMWTRITYGYRSFTANSSASRATAALVCQLQAIYDTRNAKCKQCRRYETMAQKSARERQRVYNFVLSLSLSLSLGCSRSFALSPTNRDDQTAFSLTSEREHERALSGPIETRLQAARAVSSTQHALEFSLLEENNAFFCRSLLTCHFGHGPIGRSALLRSPEWLGGGHASRLQRADWHPICCWLATPFCWHVRPEFSE
ncbi:hypothetical protein PR048_010528 [Dryococelus australis]|uniref:Uncharacterized protein n=1 Tax=Dryococelus australis TaxID=614101 RepID=A0ABQ9I2Z0_9NEOP|nr:hypothetical protein PR048_010528 [Dryococelus australis]